MSVKIYVEGGGDDEDTITRCRQGFAAYCAKAAPGRSRPRIVPCGGRNQTFDKFKAAVGSSNASDLCVLLVDSEGAVGATSPTVYLSSRDKWDFSRLKTHHIFLMVQAMEAWFLADRETLAAFYDGGFLPKSLPGASTNIEAVSKDDLESALKKATRRANTKGEYHKINHGAALLALIDPIKVENASPHAARFHQFLRSL